MYYNGYELWDSSGRTIQKEETRTSLNIFHLHQKPDLCARDYVDVHVRKILIEACQMLSTAVRHAHFQSPSIANVAFVNSLYRATHQNHPMNLWVRASYNNWYWTLEHAIALHEEYQSRFSKTNAVYANCLVYLLNDSINKLMAETLPYEFTAIPRCMPDRYKVSSDPIYCYRLYYKFGKAHVHGWTYRPRPAWMDELPELPNDDPFLAPTFSEGDAFEAEGDLLEFRTIARRENGEG